MHKLALRPIFMRFVRPTGKFHHAIHENIRQFGSWLDCFPVLCERHPKLCSYRVYAVKCLVGIINVVENMK